MNYYNILDCNKNDSIDIIKKNYRKLALLYHPDKNPNGEEEFKKIAEAYEILSDPIKKKEYDTNGVYQYSDKDALQTFKEGFNEMPDDVSDAFKTLIVNIGSSKEYSFLKLIYKSLPQNTRKDMSFKAYNFADTHEIPNNFMEIIKPLWK